jgi:hypothetical protein
MGRVDSRRFSLFNTYFETIASSRGRFREIDGAHHILRKGAAGSHPSMMVNFSIILRLYHLTHLAMRDRLDLLST